MSDKSIEIEVKLKINGGQILLDLADQLEGMATTLRKSAEQTPGEALTEFGEKVREALQGIEVATKGFDSSGVCLEGRTESAKKLSQGLDRLVEAQKALPDGLSDEARLELPVDYRAIGDDEC